MTTSLAPDPWRDGRVHDVMVCPKGRRMEVHLRLTQEVPDGPSFIDLRDYSPEDAASGAPPWGQGVWFRATPENLSVLIEALVRIRNGEVQ